MTVRDFYHNTDIQASLVPAIRTAAAIGAAVDLRGYDAAAVTVTFGGYTDGTHTPTLEHSVDGTTYTTVAATDVTGPFVPVDSVEGANCVQALGYTGQQRYLRVKLDVVGATIGAATSAIIVAAEPHNAPVN